MSVPDVFRRITTALDQAGIGYMLSGSFASAHYGAPGWKIDLIIRKSRAFSQEEFRRRQRVNLHDVPLFLASAEDVVISKLEWAKLAQSRRQIEDAASILRVRWDALDHSYMAKWIIELDLKKEWDDAQRVAGVMGPQ
jgi:hypothetical protein